jgi:hypothetical protein
MNHIIKFNIKTRLYDLHKKGLFYDKLVTKDIASYLLATNGLDDNHVVHELEELSSFLEGLGLTNELSYIDNQLKVNGHLVPTPRHTCQPTLIHYSLTAWAIKVLKIIKEDAPKVETETLASKTLRANIVRDERQVTRLTTLIASKDTLISLMAPACKHYGYDPIRLDQGSEGFLLSFKKIGDEKSTAVAVRYNKYKDNYYFTTLDFTTLDSLLRYIVKDLTNKMAGR